MGAGDCIVALLDMLGARTADEEVTDRLYRSMGFLRERMEFRAHDMVRQGQGWIQHLPSPQTLAFGDSLLFLWEVGQESKWLPVVGQLLSDVFLDALEKGVPLRGAISYGHAQYDNAVVLGPAISDAAEWYEEVNALAVVVTPRTGLLLDDIECQMGAKRLARAFIRHGFRLKRQEGDRQLWTVSWPASPREHAQGQSIGGQDIRRTVLSWLREFAMPYGTECKYYEALRVFDEYEREFPHLQDHSG